MFRLDISPPKTTNQASNRIITPKGVRDENLLKQYAWDIMQCKSQAEAIKLMEKIVKKTPFKSPFVGKYDSGKWRTTERELIRMMIPYAPKQPLDGPLLLVVRWQYPYRRADNKWKKSGEEYSCDTLPDTDNLIKGLKDIMEGLGFYKNDSQVARDDFHKFWGPNPGIFISLNKIK